MTAQGWRSRVRTVQEKGYRNAGRARVGRAVGEGGRGEGERGEESEGLNERVRAGVGRRGRDNIGGRTDEFCGWVLGIYGGTA